MSKTNVSYLVIVLSALKKVEGRTRLQKIMYLLKKLYVKDLPYTFKPYYYGPYSDELQDDLKLLVDVGLVKEERKEIEYGTQYVYQVSEDIKEILTKFLNTLEASERKKLKQIQQHVKKLNKYPTSSLIALAKALMNNDVSIDDAKTILDIN